jgi:Phage tail tube protein
MVLADSNRTKISMKDEITWGVNDSTAQLMEINYLSSSLTHKIENKESNITRSDRQVKDIVQTAQNAEGGIDFELVYGDLDNAYKNAFQSTWSAVIAVSETSDISCVASTNSFDSAGGNFPGDIGVGRKILVAGMVTTPTNQNGIYTVVSDTTSSIVVQETLADETAPATAVTIKSSGMLRNGTTKTSQTIEIESDDLSLYDLYTGCRVNNLKLDLQSNEIVTGSVDYLCKQGVLSAATGGTGTNISASEFLSLNAVGNLAIYEDHATATDTLASMSFELQNNLRLQPQLTSDTPAGIGSGKCRVTGTIEKYFENVTKYNAFIAGTAMDVSWTLTDDDSNIYILTFPRIKYTGNERPISGSDSDVKESCPFQALRDSTTNCTIQLDRFTA